MIDKERYATIGTWVEVFRKEGRTVSRTSLRNKLNEAGIIGQTARDRMGHLLREGFYSEPLVRRLLSALLQQLPEADESGFFEKNGEIYGTQKSLPKILGLSESVIRTNIQGSGLIPQSGKSNGRIRDFYAISEVQKLCERLLQPLPQAGEDGTFEKDGQTYGTRESLARLLSLSDTGVSSRLRRSSLQPIQGKDKGGRILDFYRLTEVQRLFEDICQDIPQADKSGFFTIDGETYGTIKGCARVLGVSPATVESRLKNSLQKPIKGKPSNGRVSEYYALSSVSQLCSDHIQEAPQADEKGLLDIGGSAYGTITRLAQMFGVYTQALALRIRRSDLKPTRGRNLSGVICSFYPMTQVRELCADLIAKRRKE